MTQFCGVPPAEEHTPEASQELTEQMLNICRDLFQYLNSSGIRYCHWKSNSHLDKALSGRTDLDVLVHPDDSGRFRDACIKFGLKKVLSPPLKRFEGIEDHLGFDRETGALIHLHVHYKLGLGQRFIKNHHLPLEEMLLNNLVIKDGIAVPTPEVELMLLIIRAHMKLDLLSLVKQAVRGLQGRYYCPFPQDIENELAWLIGMYDPARFENVLSMSGLPLSRDIFTGFIDKFSGKSYGCLDTSWTQRRILSGLRGFRRRIGAQVCIEYVYQLFINSRIGRFAAGNTKKTMDGRGRVFSLVGADGSGKSTLIADLEKWLSWKLAVKRYYYGFPKSRVFELLFSLIQASRKLRSPLLADLLESFLWVAVAWHRYRVSQLSISVVNDGAVVLTDRFPLKDFHMMDSPMDGPRLGGRKGLLCGYFADMEAGFYEKINMPDRIFVLQVDIDELRRRKTDLEFDTHSKKAYAVNGVKDGGCITMINANNKYSDVRLEIQKKIWEAL